MRGIKETCAAITNRSITSRQKLLLVIGMTGWLLCHLNQLLTIKTNFIAVWNNHQLSKAHLTERNIKSILIKDMIC